ncbi:hypothetical protein [Streptomyces formicae]|uniref:Integral membrane protein n=1 Tax=Streptomyces formicae TaxID=1616117 RepID=A0ABY3WCC3_9ACTN|nr:hypothetical protein [Streptomyces formicae]UNM10216.1 hypothetical protein J4032_00645 [Streptomyces formicae]
MATHAAVPVHRHGALGWVVPLTIGALYGLYTSFMTREDGASAGAQFAVGIVSAAVMAGLCYAVGRFQHAMPREVRAAAYAVLMGCAVGYLYSLSGRSVLTVTVLALALAAATFIVTFYYYYTHED